MEKIDTESFKKIKLFFFGIIDLNHQECRKTQSIYIIQFSRFHNV